MEAVFVKVEDHTEDGAGRKYPVINEFYFDGEVIKVKLCEICYSKLQVKLDGELIQLVGIDVHNDPCNYEDILIRRYWFRTPDTIVA